MKKDNGTTVPSNKTIKKPKFILEFAVCLAVCLTVSSVLTDKYLSWKKDSTARIIYDEYYSKLENIGSYLRTYAAAAGISDTEYIDDMGLSLEDHIANLETAVYFYGMTTGEYGAAYIGQEKIAETPYGYYSAVAFNARSGKPRGVFLLEDASYVAPLTVYKGGKYDPVENTKRIFKYRTESDGAYSSYIRMHLAPKLSWLWWESIYVNEETHRFLPGKVKIMDYPAGGVIEEFDLTPEDTKGYTYVETADDAWLNVNGYVDPEKAEQPLREMISPEGESGGAELLEQYWPEWSFRATQKYPWGMSIYELLPITSRVMWVQDTLVAILVALVISVLWYQRKKYIWAIFEYRKATTEAMAHDLKTPLAAISMYAECMEEQPEKSTESTGKIRENVTEMNQMLEKILNFSKSEGGENTLTKSDVDVENLIRETVSKYEDLFRKNRIDVKIYKEENCVIRTDENLMRQTIENLLSNCAKYAEPGSETRIFIRSGQLAFSNRTSLSGVNVEDLKKPFVKGDESRGENGTGLGLAIVDNNLKILGYRLGLELADGWFTASAFLK